MDIVRSSRRTKDYNEHRRLMGRSSTIYIEVPPEDDSHSEEVYDNHPQQQKKHFRTNGKYTANKKMMSLIKKKTIIFEISL